MISLFRELQSLFSSKLKFGSCLSHLTIRLKCALNGTNGNGSLTKTFAEFKLLTRLARFCCGWQVKAEIRFMFALELNADCSARDILNDGQQDVEATLRLQHVRIGRQECRIIYEKQQNKRRKISEQILEKETLLDVCLRQVVN